jgi:hypothetical protein
LKQEAVAERLALPFSTYRCHLTAGRERLVRWLWDGPPPASAEPNPPMATSSTAAGNSARFGAETVANDSRAMAPRLSLVVLPFLNIGGGPADDPFIDGITETLTTDLSRHSGLRVISRNTAFAYKDSPLDTQDEVAARLARAVHIELISAESRRTELERPDRLDATDHALRGWGVWYRQRSSEAAQQARASFETALRLDPQNISALLGLIDTHMWEVNSFALQDRAGQISRQARPVAFCNAQ